MPLLTGQNAPRFSQYTADQFAGNGVLTTFTLSRTPPSPAALMVTIDGIKQHSNTYSIGANQLVFSEAPPSGSIIEAIAIGAQGLAFEVPDAGVTTQKLAPLAVTTDKILDSAITTEKLLDGSVTPVKYEAIAGAGGTGAMRSPTGTTAQRPAPSVAYNGLRRFNSSLGREEYYLNKFWVNGDTANGPVSFEGKTLGATANDGSVFTWVVPAGITHIFVKMWGAGGGGGAYGGWRNGSCGGGGGYSHGIVPVTAGETITMRAGQRGYGRWGANKSYPDGGGASTGGGDNQYCASGGGSSSILVPSFSSEYCMFAGGGGGGGVANGYSVNSGGAGGGIQGQPGCYSNYNSGGTNFGGGARENAGGRGGTGNNTTGGAGSFKQGGTHQNSNCYGGGGGGGWYGGGSGAYGGSSMGGGGGGSGYVHPSIALGYTATGNGRTPANSTDPWLNWHAGQDDRQYGTGGEDDGLGGPGLIIWWY